MLGITTSDAIALGSMIAALTAVCAGLVQGGRARARSDLTAADSVDELTDAVRDLARAIRMAAALADPHGVFDAPPRPDE